MSKFHIKMKLTGFELEIHGAREDAPQLARSVGAQVASFFEPAARMMQGDDAEQAQAAVSLGPEQSSKRTRAKRLTSKRAQASSDADEALEFRHDANKWGSAQQSWVTAKKAMWLLHVIKQQTDRQEMTAAQIANTFNKHFKQAKMIQTSKVSRDLGRMKTQPNAPVQEDTTKSPPLWSLTQQGEKDVQALVREALGQGAGAAVTNGAG